MCCGAEWGWGVTVWVVREGFYKDFMGVFSSLEMAEEYMSKDRPGRFPDWHVDAVDIDEELGK